LKNYTALVGNQQKYIFTLNVTHVTVESAFLALTRNLTVANTSCVSCTHNTSRASTVSP